jgi:hypothetical protein
MAIKFIGDEGIKPGVIKRKSGDANALLTRFDIVHQYSGTGNLVDISTLMLEDAVYEMHVNVISGNNANQNLDPYLRPNSAEEATAYVGQFITNNLTKDPGAQNTGTILSNPIAKKLPASGVSGNDQIQGFIFDGCNGTSGINGCFVMRLDNRKANKTVLVYGGDTEGVFTGVSQWTNTTTTWSRIGNLRFYAGTTATPWSSPDGSAVPSAISYVINIARVY